ncbi:MAG TPA: UPF0179 family protein [Methanobacteriaceae archaeon]|nr:UPF0179 family protein [Methanobacteriaceae archaeon]
MITLIGTNLAEKGLKFMHYGPSSQCEGCRFKATCIDSLEEGRMYRIKDVKDAKQPCPIHNGGEVQVVEVDRALTKVLVDSKRAFEGSRFSYNPPQCNEDCSLRSLCFPEGLYKDDKCKIVKKLGKPKEKCPKGFELTRVLVKY